MEKNNTSRFIFRQQYQNVGVIVSVVLMFMVVLTGCTRAKNESKLLDAAGMQKNYKETAAKLELPPGIVFSEKANTGGAQGFEEGVGTGNAQMYWMFAWEKEWLEQRDKNPARAQKALDVLKNEVPKSEFMTKLTDDSGRAHFAEIIKKAELGDPSGFQQEVNGIRFQRTKQ